MFSRALDSLSVISVSEQELGAGCLQIFPCSQSWALSWVITDQGNTRNGETDVNILADGMV